MKKVGDAVYNATRADFYTGSGSELEWIGSLGWAGIPSGIPNQLLFAKTNSDYVRAVKSLLDKRQDATLPEQSWPWPWPTSVHTDFAYTFFGKSVCFSFFGRTWTSTSVLIGEDGLRDLQQVLSEVIKKPRINNWPKHKGTIAFDIRSGFVDLNSGYAANLPHPLNRIDSAELCQELNSMGPYK